MQSNNYEWFITQTVESMLPCGTDRKVALGMIVDMVWHYYPESDSDHQEEEQFRKQVLILFHRPSNYTKVLFKDVTDMRTHEFLQTKEPIHMEQKSDHDSCWRSDGMRWIFKTFCEAWEYFDQFGIEGRDIDPSFHYSIFNGSPAYYFIEFEKQDKSNYYCFDYMVKIGKKIPMHEISQYMPVPYKGK